MCETKASIALFIYVTLFFLSLWWNATQFEWFQSDMEHTLVVPLVTLYVCVFKMSINYIAQLTLTSWLCSVKFDALKRKVLFAALKLERRTQVYSLPRSWNDINIQWELFTKGKKTKVNVFFFFHYLFFRCCVVYPNWCFQNHSELFCFDKLRRHLFTSQYFHTQCTSILFRLIRFLSSISKIDFVECEKHTNNWMSTWYGKWLIRLNWNNKYFRIVQIGFISKNERKIIWWAKIDEMT